MLLLTGPAGSGKTARILREFREALQAHRSARILVPTATLSEHLRNELARDGVVLRARSVSTLARFIAELAPALAPVSDAHFHLMVEQAVLRLRRAEFEKVSELAGIHSRIAATIANLDAAGCTPRNLSRVGRALAPFRDALSAIWQDVERQMEARGAHTRGELLRKLCARLDSVTLPEHLWLDGFAQLSQPEIEFLCALGARTRVTLNLPEEGVPAELKSTLLQRGFTEERLTGGRSPREVLVMPDSAERETEEIARRILVESQAGVPFREIGVIVRQPAKYEPLLRAAFERFGIPAQFLFSEALATHPTVRVLTGVIDALLGGWEHEQTLSLLRLIPGVGSSHALDELDIEIRKRLPGKGLDPLLALSRGRHLQRVLRQFLALEAWTHAGEEPEHWAARLNRLPALVWPGYVPDRLAPEELAQYRSQAAGLQAFASAIETATAWWTNTAARISLPEFWHVARTVIRLSSVSSATRSRNAVHVISAYEARQWDLSVAFVCGLVEKEFPAQHARDPFLSDAALRDLARFGVHARTSADKDAEEFGLFDAVRSRARDLLVLSYPRTDARGQRTLPSIFLKGRDAGAAVPVVRPALPPPIAQWRAPARIQSPDLVPVLTEKHGILSVSSLEQLLQCPFAFFSARALKIKEMPERPEDRLTFLLQGNIAHEVLREWYVERPAMDPLFDRVFERICVENNVVPGFRTERLRRSMKMALQRFAAGDKYPRPLHSDVEQSFELVIDPTLTVRGRLDRVDRFADGSWVVVDYKYSSAANTKDKVTDETKLQGPLYALALENKFGRPASAMVYVSLKDDSVKAFGWGEIPGFKGLVDLTPEWIPNALERVSAMVAEFRSGVVHPRPLQHDSCRYCDYRDACRIEQPAAAPASRA